MTCLNAMTTLAVTEAAFRIPSFCAALVASLAGGEAMQFPPFSAACHFGGGSGGMEDGERKEKCFGRSRFKILADVFGIST